MTSAAARMKSYRARREAGLVVLPVLIDEVETAQMLIAGGMLAPHDAEDRDKIAHALERQIGILIELSRRYT